MVKHQKFSKYYDHGCTLMTPLLKAIMDDITVLTKTVHAAKAVLEKLGDLIKWLRIKLKVKKSRSKLYNYQ